MQEEHYHPAPDENSGVIEPQIQELGEREKYLKVLETTPATHLVVIEDLTNKGEDVLEAESPVAELQRRLESREQEADELRRAMDKMNEEKAKAMADLILSEGEIEEAQIKRQKEIGKLTQEIEKLTQESEAADQQMKQKQKKKKKLGDFQESYTTEMTAKLYMLQKEIDQLQRMLTNPEEPNCTEPALPPDTATNASGQHLKFVERQIEEAEKDLECPVCLEIAREAPIFRCEEDHLICSKCRGKMDRCPMCRVEYPREVSKTKRFRMAERQAERLADLYKERQSSLEST